jgi:RNA polymerase sigma-70 factor (ECF subfamily)
MVRDQPITQKTKRLLKIWEQMTFEELAGVLDISPATAASRYRYALGKLRQMIATNSNEGIAHEVR